MSDGGAKRQRVVLLGSFARSLTVFRGPLIAAMAARGHEVHALAPEIDPATADAVRALGAEPHSITLGRTSLDPFEALRTRRELTRLMRRLGPDVVIAYTIKPIVLGAAAARAAGARFVPMVTGLGFAFTGGREPKRVLSRIAATRLYARAFRGASVAIFQNPDDRADFARMGLLPRDLPTVLVAGSGVDIDHYAPEPLPPAPAFLMAGRYLGDKGVREYGEAGRRLKQDHPGVPVRLVGFLDTSPDSIGAEALAAIVAGGVEECGRVDDIRPAMAEASVYVLPSYREGTPRSVLEAAAMGRAVVTTDAPGCRETVIDGETGLLVPPRDADALTRAMRRFIEEPDLAARMGAAARRFVADKYDVRRVNADILRHAGL